MLLAAAAVGLLWLLWYMGALALVHSVYSSTILAPTEEAIAPRPMRASSGPLAAPVAAFQKASARSVQAIVKSMGPHVAKVTSAGQLSAGRLTSVTRAQAKLIAPRLGANATVAAAVALGTQAKSTAEGARAWVGGRTRRVVGGARAWVDGWRRGDKQ